MLYVNIIVYFEINFMETRLNRLPELYFVSLSLQLLYFVLLSLQLS